MRRPPLAIALAVGSAALILVGRIDRMTPVVIAGFLVLAIAAGITIYVNVRSR